MFPDDSIDQARQWFEALGGRVAAACEALEDEAVLRGLVKGRRGRFERAAWERAGGGGVLAVLRGRVLEKAVVNVWMARTDGASRAATAAIAVVAYPANPYVPAAHFTARLSVGAAVRFAAAAELVPAFPFAADLEAFHAALAGPCEQWRSGAHALFRQECERAFFLPHRGEPRGAGGVFFEDLESGDAGRDFALVQGVGEAFLTVYPRLVARRMASPFTAAARHAQNRKRGRWVEFALLCDRDLLAGLRDAAAAEAVLAALPPTAEW